MAVAYFGLFNDIFQLHSFCNVNDEIKGIMKEGIIDLV
jgi:hypothetical protein